MTRQPIAVGGKQTGKALAAQLAAAGPIDPELIAAARENCKTLASALAPAMSGSFDTLADHVPSRKFRRHP